MNELNQENHQALPDREGVKKRLQQLLELSQDMYYDQYLNQMLKDLESGKATPAQVNKEADRTYEIYKQRMGKTPVREINQHKNTVEFKIGASVFSIIGAVFVLIAFIIFGFHFLNGIWQGLGLYAVSSAVLLFSELLIKKQNRQFSLVITGIGIGSLYVSTIINYLVLEIFNGMTAMIITMVIAVSTILISRKKDSTTIRLISIIGCYICFLFLRGVMSELNFLVITIILFVINMAGVFFTNQKNKSIINFVHMILATLIAWILTFFALNVEMESIFTIGLIISTLIFLNTVFYKQRKELKPWFIVLYCVEIGLCGLLLVDVFRTDLSFYTNTGLGLYYRLLTEAMLLAVGISVFVLLEKNKFKWIQYYFVSITVLFLVINSDYVLEEVITVLVIFVITKLLSGIKELTVCDCIVSIWAALTGLGIALFHPSADGIYLWFFAAAFILSSFMVKRIPVFHEIMITLFLLMVGIHFSDNGWFVPVCVGILMACFLWFHHLPMFKGANQLPYNIVNLVLAGILCLFTFFCFDYRISSVTMLIGALAIILIFKKRYGLEIKKKYLILSGFLTYMIMTAHFETPIIVSILLMAIALSCVGIGFLTKDKAQRICGLSMAMLVCVKLVIYDFRELELLSKAILFLIVGIIALVISFIYIQLEKKENKEEAGQQNHEVTDTNV